MDWTEKYRPQSLRALIGNGTPVSQLTRWAHSWEAGIPKERAVVLAGPPGVGKTTAALALARDMGWSVIELNASDARNADTIRKIATAGAMHQTLGTDGSFQSTTSGGRKLIILDEADNLYERLAGENAAGGSSDLSDKGGKKQIIDTIKQTKQPMVLIVNDLYALEKGSGSALKSLALTIKFQKVQARSMPKILDQIARAEGVRVDTRVLQDLSEKSAGDLRAAVRDLQALCTGREVVTLQDLGDVGYRDTTTNMFAAMDKILKAKRMSDVRRDVMSVDSTPEDMIMWIDENMPKQYLDTGDLVRAYERLSRADVFLGRARSTNNYRLWAYANDLMTSGVHVARQNNYSHWGRFGFPSYISKMARSKGARGVKQSLAVRLAAHHHCSTSKARNEIVPVFELLFQRDTEFAAHQIRDLELEEAEVKVLLAEHASAKKLKEIYKIVEELGPKPIQPVLIGGALGGFQEREAHATLDALEDVEDDPDEDPVDEEEPLDAADDEPSDDGEAAPPAKEPESKRPGPGQGQQTLF